MRPRSPLYAVPLAGLFGFAALALGCPHAADERARLDLEVGRADVEDVRVAVADGAAVVRSIGRDRVVLWASQPALTVSVEGSEPRTFELTIKNAMPNLKEAGGADVRSGVRPTEKLVSVTLSGAGATTLRFAPDDDAGRDPFRIIMFADVQEAIDRVGEVYARMNADPRVRFAIMNGDQTQQGSRAQLEAFEESLGLLDVPCYMTLGNHELGTTEALFREVFGRGNHHFTFRGAHFTLLDSASATIDPVAYEWLDGWLARAREDVHLVSMHIPPFDPVGTRNGAFGSRAEAAKLVARLADARVDATYYGHVHSYYAYANGNIPAFISGGGGAIPERMDGIGRNFLTVDIDPVRALVETSLVRVD